MSQRILKNSFSYSKDDYCPWKSTWETKASAISVVNAPKADRRNRLFATQDNISIQARAFQDGGDTINRACLWLGTASLILAAGIVVLIFL